MTNIKEFGARGDGTGLETAFIQKAIDECAAKGGGTVLLPAGLYKSGSIILKNNVTLHLENGAVIEGSGDINDYPGNMATFIDAVGNKLGRSLIYAENAENVSLEGRGTIRGAGKLFPREHPQFKERPFLLRFNACRNVSVSDLRLENSAAWVSHYFKCEDVRISSLLIKSRVNDNNDGIDIDSCKRVKISDCSIDTGDDAICIKSTSPEPSRDISIANCLITTSCAAIKIGTESIGDFRNIAVSNCVIYDTEHGGIKLFSVDGARMENIVISNIIMDNVMGPIMLRLGERKRTYFEGQEARPSGCMKDILISSIIAKVSENKRCPAGICISGIPGHRIENVVFENMTLEMPGGFDGVVPSNVPENEKNYPTFNMFGILPSWAFFIRHVKNVSLRNIKIKQSAPDVREVFFCEDADGIKKENVIFTTL